MPSAHGKRLLLPYHALPRAQVHSGGATITTVKLESQNILQAQKSLSKRGKEQSASLQENSLFSVLEHYESGCDGN